MIVITLTKSYVADPYLRKKYFFAFSSDPFVPGLHNLYNDNYEKYIKVLEFDPTV